MSSFLTGRRAGVLLTTAIVALTLVAAYIHLSLGGLLFTLNGLGYIGLAVLLVVGAVGPTATVRRFSWFPRIGIVGYAATTIAAYLIMGPYFSLGLITKGIEGALIGLVVLDIIRVYGGPFGLVRAALASVAPILPARMRPTN